ncbi:hypothetical protein Q1J45_25570 [Pseudomonas rhodesiae]|jgi:hypothetical protein|nr:MULTISPECIES: hypothetical protein [unclassified Pseudomonas]WLH39294.1 hypothetical protein PSH94_17025 [Pseudomonas sp. FP2254]
MRIATNLEWMMDEEVNQGIQEELSFLFEETRNFQSIARNGF